MFQAGAAGTGRIILKGTVIDARVGVVNGFTTAAVQFLTNDIIMEADIITASTYGLVSILSFAGTLEMRGNITSSSPAREALVCGSATVPMVMKGDVMASGFTRAVMIGVAGRPDLFGEATSGNNLLMEGNVFSLSALADGILKGGVSATATTLQLQNMKIITDPGGVSIVATTTQNIKVEGACGANTALDSMIVETIGSIDINALYE